MTPAKFGRSAKSSEIVISSDDRSMKPVEHIAVFLPVAIVVGLVGWSIYGTVADNNAKATYAAQRESEARAKGFNSAPDLDAASRSGFTDASLWRVELERQGARVAAERTERERAEAVIAAAAAKQLAATQAALAEANRNPVDRVTLPAMNWKIGGFGSVGLVSVTVENGNDYAIKDIGINCTFSGKSGTELSSPSRVIFDTVKAKSKRIFKEFNIGLINHQSARARCEVISASRL